MDVRIEIESRYSDVPRLVHEVMALLADFSSEEAISKVVIGLHEVVHNIIEHGYAGEDGHAIRLWARRRGHYAVLVIEDDGRPHPRTPHPEPETITSLEAMAERGRGLWLISQCFARVRYVRKEGHNRTLLYLRHADDEG